MAEKNPSSDPKTPKTDSKNVPPTTGSSTDVSQPSTSMSSAGDATMTPAGDSERAEGPTYAPDISPECERAFQTLFEQGDFSAVMEMLETEELQAPNGIPATVVYERLLAVYLLENDFYNAKLLWKRIPAPLKTADSELVAIWAVGQKVSKSDYAGIYEALRRSWKTHEKLMRTMLEMTRQRAIQLVAKAYESIAIENLVTLLGTSTEEEAVTIARNLDWTVEGRMIFPKAGSRTQPEGSKNVSSDAHLGLLTDYVSFLESH